jgi:peptidyl-prolyl cis-trans isomerase SurA
VPAALLALVLCLVPCSARAALVERIVAIVGDQAILLSDMRARARPYAQRIEEQIPPGARRAAALSQMYKTVLERMIDEELERKAASRAHVVVSAQEVDDAIARIAAQNRVSVEKLVTEALASGLSEAEYRQEIRRQVLEAKLINLRLQGRVRVTTTDAYVAYRRLVLEERTQLGYRAAWIVIRAPRGPGRGEREALASRLAEQARAGADFGALARRWSDDARSRSAGGVLEPMDPGALAPALEAVLRSLEPGEVSSPTRVGDDLYVLKLLERDDSELPGFEESKDDMLQRVYLEKMNKARRHWLDGLRQREHVEIRL